MWTVEVRLAQVLASGGWSAHPLWVCAVARPTPRLHVSCPRATRSEQRVGWQDVIDPVGLGFGGPSRPLAHVRRHLHLAAVRQSMSPADEARNGQVMIPRHTDLSDRLAFRAISFRFARCSLL